MTLAEWVVQSWEVIKATPAPEMEPGWGAALLLLLVVFFVWWLIVLLHD